MRVIHKYTLRPRILMELGAQILAVQWQGDDFVVWALVDTNQPMGRRRMLMIGTGHAFSSPQFDEAIYISTHQMPDGLVVHFFDLGYDS